MNVRKGEFSKTPPKQEFLKEISNCYTATKVEYLQTIVGVMNASITVEMFNGFAVKIKRRKTRGIVAETLKAIDRQNAGAISGRSPGEFLKELLEGFLIKLMIKFLKELHHELQEFMKETQ